MARTATTRMGLLAARAALQTATSGTRLLRSKREVLASELFRTLREVVVARERLDEKLRDAAVALLMARALEPVGAVETLAAASLREVPIAVTRQRVWGVPTATVTAPRLVRSSDARGSSPWSWGPSSTEAARRHEEALEVLLGIASRELRLRRLGEEVRETSRRVNALEQLVIPRLEHEAARIELALDERAREDTVRLQRALRHRRR